MEDDIRKLNAQIQQLQTENAYLKRLLDEAGISYSCLREICPTEITRQLARRFYAYFWGRTDVYSKKGKYADPSGNLGTDRTMAT